MSDVIGYLIHCSICDSTVLATKKETVCPDCLDFAVGDAGEDHLPLGEVQG